MAKLRSSRISDPFFTLIAFSIYSSIMGAVLLFAPKQILPLVGIEETINSHTYMLGFVLLAASFYYLASGLGRSRHFAKLTVYTRFAVPIVTTILYIGGNVPLNFVILGIVDFLGGVWTFATLNAKPLYEPPTTSISAAEQLAAADPASVRKSQGAPPARMCDNA